HPLSLHKEGTQRTLLLVTSDKGLCGAFNTNLIREAVRYVQKYTAANVQLFVVGRKGRDYFRRMGFNIVKDYTNIFNTLGFQHAEIVTQDLLQAYAQPGMAAIDLIYGEFKSVIQKRVTIKQLLPLLPRPEAAVNTQTDFIYEPAKEQLIEGLVQRFL